MKNEEKKPGARYYFASFDDIALQPSILSCLRRVCRIVLTGLWLSSLSIISLPATAQNADDPDEIVPSANDFYRMGAVEIAKISGWLSEGGDPNTILDSSGNTFMHYASVASNALPLLQAAVNLGGDCNRQNYFDATPLHFAAAQEGAHGTGPEAVRILVQCKQRTADDNRADPNAQDRRDNTPLHAVYASVEIHAPPPPPNIADADNTIGKGGARGDILRALLEETGADPNIKNQDGDIAMMLMFRHAFITFKTTEHVSLFLEHGADPNTRNRAGMTPLMETLFEHQISRFGSHNGNSESLRIIRLLFEYGADPDLRNGEGETPLIFAAQHESDITPEMKALLAGGADPCLRDHSGRLAYDHTPKGSAEGRKRRLLLREAGGYPDPETGICERELDEVKQAEEELALDQSQRSNIQSCLAQLNFDPGAPDGILGPGSRSAIRAWQAAQGAKGIAAAGFLSADGLKALLASCEETSSITTEQAGAGDEAEIYEVGQKFRDCEECPQMVVVPAGSYEMGSPAWEEDRYDNEGPQHWVEIAEPFAVGVYEVTRGEWRRFVEATRYRTQDRCWTYEDGDWQERSGRSWRDPGYAQTDGHPVACMNWNDAKAYVDWLSDETGHDYRLLSESEWEYVARAGTTTPFHYGETISPEQANYNGNYPYGSGRTGIYREKTLPVGSFSPNAFGLHDVHGNVWEWVEDCWHEDYVGAPLDGSAWVQRGDCAKRVLRGGSWDSKPWFLRSADRERSTTESRVNGDGFRVARTLAP